MYKFQYSDLTVRHFPQQTCAPMRMPFNVLQDRALLGVTDRHKLALCAIPATMQSNTKNMPPEGGERDVRKDQSNRDKERARKRRATNGDPWQKIETRKRRGGCGWRSVFLLFTNVFISSFFTLMWLTVVGCSTAISISSSPSSSSSSSKGFEPTGAVLVGTVRLTTWDTVRDRLLTCTHTHTKIHLWHKWPAVDILTNVSIPG